jgi:23S rRNA pseudouridine2605 synthase
MLERLQKIIAHAGIASRRHAEQLILSGQVRLNGKTVTELGTKADPSKDKIEAAGRMVESEERHAYLLMHKPTEVVSALTDPEGRKTLRNFLRGFPQRVYPVGSLDYTASGLVLLTNDGGLTAQMLKNWSSFPQLYHIKIKGRLTLEELDRFGKEAGVKLQTVRQPDATRGRAANFWYEVRMFGGKMDGLRRVLFRENHPVEKVKRVGLGPLTLEAIPTGRYRLLSKAEVDSVANSKKPAKARKSS